MRGPKRWLGVFGALFALSLVAAACSSAGASTGGDPSLKIASPSAGATGSCDELSQSVIAYGNSVMISDLSPGMHTIEASLRNADHSDAGVSATVSVDVSGGGSAGSQAGSQSGSQSGMQSGSQAGSPTGASGSRGGYGY
jgi:hypothetical protein